ncbi:MAG: hypothetical protein HWD58_13470 [Bacteroidota bacterium]|nr:MAG: hypothetical protein HWD58_13470 [Bacteroidota bacterium]
MIDCTVDSSGKSGHRVLSLNSSGDVIYVPGGSGGINFCTTFPPPPNNVVKATANPNEVCQTNITDLNPIGFVGINNTNPNDALDVNNLPGSTGDIDINNPFNRYEINDDQFFGIKESPTICLLGWGPDNSPLRVQVVTTMSLLAMMHIVIWP